MYVYYSNFGSSLSPLTHHIHDLFGHFHAKGANSAAQTIEVMMHDQFGPRLFEEFNKTSDILEIPTGV